MVRAVKKEFRSAGYRAEFAYIQLIGVDRVMIEYIVLLKKRVSAFNAAVKVDTAFCGATAFKNIYRN